MSRSRWLRRGCLTCPIGLALVVLFVPVQAIRWSGGFDRAAYRLTFLDASGRPVPGVTLRVETQAGGPSYMFPVDDFLPDQAPRSDAEGQMTFHHVGSGPEFGGKETRNIFGMRSGDTMAPQYICVFSVAGREVHRIRYGNLQLQMNRAELESVKKTSWKWNHTDWPKREYMAHHHDWEAHRFQLFDGDKNGTLDREERVAAHQFDVVFESSLRGGWSQEVEFFVVERTITISIP